MRENSILIESNTRVQKQKQRIPSLLARVFYEIIYSIYYRTYA